MKDLFNEYKGNSLNEIKKHQIIVTAIQSKDKYTVDVTGQESIADLKKHLTTLMGIKDIERIKLIFN